MTNTNPLTDRLQRMARKKAYTPWNHRNDEEGTQSVVNIEDLDTIIAHTIKETLTAVEEEMPESYGWEESAEFNRGVAVVQAALKYVLTTLTSSNDSDV